jgi:hypothetical protein
LIFHIFRIGTFLDLNYSKNEKLDGRMKTKQKTKAEQERQTGKLA